jgi:hypothetical protein
MSLWDVLTFLSGAVAFGGALGSAKAAGGGTPLRIGVLVGIAVGGFSTWAVRAVGQRLFEHADRVGERGRANELHYRAIYLLTALWIPVAGVLGFLLDQAVIRMATSP